MSLHPYSKRNGMMEDTGKARESRSDSPLLIHHYFNSTVFLFIAVQ